MLTTIKSQVPKSLLIVVKFLWITYHWHLNIFEFEQNSFDGARYVISYKTFKKTTTFIPFEKNVILCKKWRKEFGYLVQIEKLSYVKIVEKEDCLWLLNGCTGKVKSRNCKGDCTPFSAVKNRCSENFEKFQGDPC